MADSSTFFGHSFMAPPAKRKRFSIGQPEETPCSIIKDTRITQTQALRLNCPTITILVGPALQEDEEDTQLLSTQEAFYVHEYAICDHSPFFSNAMKPEWASLRPDPRTIELPDDDPAAFALYMTWLYSRKLPILPEGGDDLDPNEGYHTLSYAYVLGERLMDIEFKNAISDAYVLYARGLPPAKRAYPSNEEIRIIYSGTAEASPIRRLLVDIWCVRGKFEWIEQDPDLPKDFLIEVTKALLKVRTSTDNLSRPWKNSHDQYHEK